MNKSYSKLRKLHTFEERFDYLVLRGTVGVSTFGFDRYLNQMLYNSKRWLKTRDEIIIRDEACDLGIKGYDIYGLIIVHHMNPLTVEDIENGNEIIFDNDFLICTTHRTHMAIHYGDKSLLPKLPVIRYPGDTSPWLK